ncbi:hypothetical protein XH88_25875 [Bradyrhizobium sp. CCBAU 51627]|nr:hypothetical protein [Bradyrhizobium sp. CCBAU 51627]
MNDDELAFGNNEVRAGNVAGNKNFTSDMISNILGVSAMQTHEKLKIVRRSRVTDLLCNFPHDAFKGTFSRLSTSAKQRDFTRMHYSRPIVPKLKQQSSCRVHEDRRGKISNFLLQRRLVSYQVADLDRLPLVL